VARFRHFSTRTDYEQLVAATELLADLYFVHDTSYEAGNVPFVRGLLSVPDLGIIQANKYQQRVEPRYWVFPDEPRLGLRPIGPVERRHYVLDGATLPVCLQFKPNGLFAKKALICGTLETTLPIGETVPLFRKITKAFSRVYTKAKYYHDVTYVGPDALSRQKKRYRLTANPNLPRKDDFKLTAKE
jgi:hypothetical protein